MHLAIQYILLLGACYWQVPNLDQAHIDFEVSHLGVLKVEGRFTSIVGEFEKKDEIWVIYGYIDVGSISTGNDSRDETVLTEQYLNAGEYPEVPFLAELDLTKETLSVEATVRGLRLEFETQLKKVNNELVSNPVVIDREEMGLDFGIMDTLIGNDITFVIHSGTYF